jgi:hypothetical protein
MVVVLQEQKTAALLLVQLFVQMVSWSYRSPGFPPWTEGNDGGKMRQGPRLARANDWQNGREVVVVNSPAVQRAVSGLAVVVVVVMRR